MTHRTSVGAILGTLGTGRIDDLATREALQQLSAAILQIEERFGKAINEEGVITANLPGGISVDGDLQVIDDLTVDDDATIAGILAMTGGPVLRFTVAGITASTSQSQGQGALTADVNEVATVANALDTVTMPAAVAGRRVEVVNHGANVLQLFPASGDRISLTVDEPEVIPINGERSFLAVDDTVWVPDATHSTRGYFFTSRGIGAGTYFSAGYYEAPAAEAVLNQGALTQTLGAANVPYAAHVFFVAKQAGAAAGGTTGVADVTVSGTSITDSGTRQTSDTEVLVADNTAASTDEYFETEKKWLGQVTLTIATTGDRTTFDLSGNYGFAKYEDFGNNDFTVNDFEAVGLAAANDSAFDVELLYHSDAGWTYSAAAFVPGGTVLASMATTHSTESDIDNNVPFAFKFAQLSQVVHGAAQDGVLIRITTGQNNSVQDMDIHIGVGIH